MANVKILAVESSQTMRRIIINTLKWAGYPDVTEATDGKDALAKMKINQYDFVITGWNMPEMDGIEFVSSVRKNDQFKKTPIVMVSTRSAEEDIVEAIKVGVTGYIVKPFSPGILKEKIDQILGNT